MNTFSFLRSYLWVLRSCFSCVRWIGRFFVFHCNVLMRFFIRCSYFRFVRIWLVVFLCFVFSWFLSWLESSEEPLSSVYKLWGGRVFCGEGCDIYCRRFLVCCLVPLYWWCSFITLCWFTCCHSKVDLIILIMLRFMMLICCSIISSTIFIIVVWNSFRETLTLSLIVVCYGYVIFFN